MVDTKTLKGWAAGRDMGRAGRPGPAQAISGSKKEPITKESLGIDDPDEPVPPNRLWGGELAEDEMLDGDDASAFLGWLQEHEPDLHDQLVGYAAAYLTEDQALMDAHRADLMVAEQVLNPEYDPFEEGQRELALENVEYMIRDQEPESEESEEFTIAIAKGVAAARAGVDLIAEDPDAVEEEGV